MRPAIHAHLPLYLAAAYTLLAVYGSLYPFTGWTDSGVPLTAFLEAGWPRHWTAFDLATNVAAYLPLGFLWVTALRQPLPTWAAVVAATLLGTALSLGLETLQNYLPSRVPSNLDLGTNAVGALLGSLAGARWGATMLDGGRFHDLRHRLFVPGTMADAGLLLLCLWLLSQLDPATLLFGNGALHALFELPAPVPFSAEAFVRIETLIVASHTLAATLLVSLLARAWRRTLALAVVAAALAVKSFAFWLMMSGAGGSAWATPGSLAGLAAGLFAWFLAGWLALRWQQALAALSLLVATTLVNLAPENPYLANTIQVWNPGQFLNFHGLTSLAASLWPFLALPWLMLARTDK